MKFCEIDPTKICDSCGDCEICDLDPNKKCDNCEKCLDFGDDDGYAKIKIDRIIVDEDETDNLEH